MRKLAVIPIGILTLVILVGQTPSSFQPIRCRLVSSSSLAVV